MTATFEFVCETFVITFKGKICSDSNKYIVSYGWHWNQWIWRSSSRCECVDQLGQLGCLASCVLAHLVVQYTFYLFFKIHFISFFLVKIYFIFFAHLVVQNTLSQIEYTLVLPSLKIHNTKFEIESYHHYVHAVAEEGTGVATWPVETFIFLAIVFHTLYNQARDSDLKAWQRWQSFQNFRSSFCFSPAELVDLRIPVEHVTVIADPSTRCCYVHRICWIPNKFIWGEYSTGHQTIT